MNKKLRSGDRVVLITTRHGNSSANPVYDPGRYDNVIGTITYNNSSREVFQLNVMWDNGILNSYSYEDVEKLSTIKEGQTIYKSIW